MKKTVILFFSILVSISAFSQGKSVQETVDYINSKDPNNFQVRVVKERELIIDYFKGGENYKTDQFYLATMDPSKTEYSAEESALIIRCMEEMPKEFKKMQEGCIAREFHTKGKLSYYNRTLIHYEGNEASRQGLINAFNHLIRICQDEGEYKYIESFE